MARATFCLKVIRWGVDGVTFVACASGVGFFGVKGKNYEHEEVGSAPGCNHFSGIGRLRDANRRDVAKRHSI
jgi:hypothetical protein